MVLHTRAVEMRTLGERHSLNQARDRTVKIPGRLIVDLFPDGMVRIVFLARTGDGNASPLTAEDLDAAEVLFITCGLTPERAAALRAEVERNDVASVDTSVDVGIAAKFRYKRP